MDGVPHPRHTKHLVGQKEAESGFLQAFNSGRLHHAWLITGPKGVGKATLAWKMTRFLLTRPADDSGLFGAPETAEATNLDMALDTPIDRRIDALSEPRLALCRRAFIPEKKTIAQNIRVEDIRKLKSFFAHFATDGGYRVAIIDAADEMNTSAANALLKLLEEPPLKVVFLLVCHQPMSLLPTIRSRCRELRCQTLSEKDLTAALSAASGDALKELPANPYVLAGGSVGEAVRLTQGTGLTLYKDLISLLSKAPGLDRARARALARQCQGKTNVSKYETLLYLIPLMLSRLARFGVLQPATYIEATKGEAGLFARLAPDAQMGRKWAQLCQSLVGRSRHARAVNLDPGAVILDMLLKIDQAAAD